MQSQLLAQQKSQTLYFDRGAKSLPPVTTGDTVQMKTKNGWKPATVTKLAHTAQSVIVNSNELSTDETGETSSRHQKSQVQRVIEGSRRAEEVTEPSPRHLK